MGRGDGCFAPKAMSVGENGVGYADQIEWNDGQDGISFLASRSSSIYKSINKIQVRSYQLLIIIKA